MSFNYGLEKRKFDKRWAGLRKEYLAAGMSEEGILEMYKFDWDAFKKERAYQSHTQRMPVQEFDDDGDEPDEARSPLLLKYFDRFSVPPRGVSEDDRYGWIMEFESDKLRDAVLQLSASDIELLTLYFHEGYRISEIAAMLGVAQPTITRKFQRIMNFLKTF